MAIVGAHRGPVSGLTHIHLLRESAAVRAGRSSDRQGMFSARDDIAISAPADRPTGARFEPVLEVETSPPAEATPGRY